MPLPKSFTTTDLCDAHGDAVGVAAPIFRSFGGTPRFCGPIATVRCFEDNSHVRGRLEEPGNDRVLVVDGSGSLRCALVGGVLGELAVQNRWAGIIVHGCVRDVGELAQCAIGILALAVHPRRSEKRGVGERDVIVTFAGVAFQPDTWLYADVDGLIVASAQL